MPRRNQIREISELLLHINRQLDAFAVEYDGLDLRRRVSKLVEIRHSSDDLGVSVLHDSLDCKQNARARIEAYLVENVGNVVSSDELAVVSGISEYGRRIRELRVEIGYKIFTGASSDEATGLKIQPDEYLLTDPSPDLDSARRWHIANRIRKLPGSAKGRILAYFQENVLKVITAEEVRYVARSSDFPRRTRELRTEDGFPIATHFTGRPDLRPGEYVLLDASRIMEPHDRRIPVEVQRVVFERDENACRHCDWKPIQWTSDDPRILELHHFVEHSARGKNTAENLMVLCSRCHDDVHAGRIELDFTT